ncbi:hypothetical protein JCM10449v2_001365 [Rhodotorula kratochvilovae]
MDAAPTETLASQIARLLPNGLGARGDEERNPVTFPDRSLHVLLALSGIDVQVVATKSATHFFDAAALEAENGSRVKVWTDQDEWAGWQKIGDPVLHIEVRFELNLLRRWADVVLVAPCSANTLAKITHGICDNILTSFLRALPAFVPVYLFPAMNTHMFSHPLTAKQLAMVQDELGYKVHGPIGKKLACGDIGIGAMTEWSDIVQLVVAEYGLKRREETA